MLTVENSSFVANEAGSAAGLYGKKLTLRDSTFSNNTAEKNGGGVILGVDGYNDGFRHTIENSTFSGNSAGHGGGVYNVGELTVRNSTFHSNAATIGSGGGLNTNGGHDYVGYTTIESSTFSGNTAERQGGGLYNPYSDEHRHLAVRATIVAGNTAPQGPDVRGQATSDGYNLIGDTSGSTGFNPTDLQNVDPVLDPEGPQDNGGPTRTIALQPGSPAIDAVTTGCPPPETDQRGIARPQNGDGDATAVCDIGAFERRSSE